ncbi:protein SIX6OS1 isoform X1 [Crotalus tigris]|uniref:protein SIX6OS1 isoform X1 n=2 Tax=Crotalus tigris TaxID=88082 RepID=UPI00192F1F5D|nr:protein SIX6OS1 isoform X1 [Crotalus tigris]XP_039175470.1 protein SIX6OS1 isoform X1 [Crotalus tigris]XP_039175471.1 protein SIX6OS1 isoform X1 [Crotalus tigris]XP_039175472.1 protein SIX6OS1 isoform X1 [Crotalus tigris]
MADTLLSNLDKLLLQLVFQLEQASYSKEYERQQIQLYTANILREKSEICHLHEEINKSEEAILSLCRQNNTNKENCNIWKPTYVILKKHEESLQKELQNYQEATEKDKKLYQDSMNQYQEVFRQHQAKYLETTIAREYYREKKEYEEIQDQVQQNSKLLKQKEAELIDLHKPGPFQSLSSWATHIASLQQNTKETLTHAAVLKQQSVELVRTAKELEKKMNYFKEHLGNVTKDQKHTEQMEEDSNVIEERAKNQERKKDFDESLFKESQHLLNEKEHTFKPLNLPSIFQKLVQSVPTVKPLFQITDRGAEKKEDLAGHSIVTSMYFNHVENENQKCDNSETKIVETDSSITNDPKEISNRLLANHKNTLTKQCFNTENTKGKKTDYKQKENKSMDSEVISQDRQTEIYTKPTGCYSSTRDEDTAATPRLITPEPNILPKTPDSGGMRTPFELFPPESEGLLAKSPAFSFLAGFTSKTQSPAFNFFDFSAFGTESSLDQSGESCSTGNINPISPHKDIGDFFGKMDNEDSFTFAFPTLPSAQVFQDGKEDFNFPFAFGSSEQSTLKGFQSASENRKPFSLF